MNSIVPRLKLQIKSDGKAVKDLVFSEFPVLFGRGSDCHVKLAEYAFLSKVHGSISVMNNTILVHDLESRNGIKRDGKKVVSTSFDGVGQFEVGGLTFEFSLGEETVMTEIDIPKPWEEKTTPVIRIPVKSKAPGRPQESREGVTLELDVQAQTAKPEEVCIQGVLTWMGDVFDIRQFYVGDHIRVGPHPTEPIFIPTYLHQVIFGRMNLGHAQFGLRQKAKWRITEQNRIADEADLRAKGQVGQTGDLTTFKLGRGQILSIQVGHDFEFHLRYIKVPQMLVLKTWIENKEVFIRAAKISLAAHAVMAVVLSFAAPKSHAPKIENVPPRFAKLLVEPPKQVFAPPPPEPKIEPPPPEPPKEEAKKEEPPPKPKVEEKKKPDPPKVVKKKKEKPKPVAATPPKKQPEPIADRQPASEPEGPPAPPKNEVLDSFANAFDAPAGPKTTAVNTKNIQITKTTTSDPSVSPSDLMKTLKSQNGKLAASGGTSATSTKIGSVGFATGGLSGKAGQNGVKAQVVGKPSFEAPAGEQGLDQKQIMKVVKQYVQAIQQCYERALLDNANLSGRIEFSWTISPAGKVSGAQVKRSEVTSGEGLSQCVIKLIEGMQFPSAKNGQSTDATIGFPFGKN